MTDNGSPDVWAIQVSVNTKAGSLVNVRATDADHLDRLLADLSLRAEMIADVEGQVLNAGRYPTPTLPVSRSTAPPGPGALTPWAAHQAGQNVEPPVPGCMHGPRERKSGVNARGPWVGWMCAAGQGAPDRCPPVFEP